MIDYYTAAVVWNAAAILGRKDTKVFYTCLALSVLHMVMFIFGRI